MHACKWWCMPMVQLNIFSLVPDEPEKFVQGQIDLDQQCVTSLYILQSSAGTASTACITNKWTVICIKITANSSIV